MSLTDNTTNLNEVLQKVRALPEAGGGSTGSDADLIIRVNGDAWSKINQSDIVIEKGDIRTIYDTANGQNTFKCELHFASSYYDGAIRECMVLPATVWVETNNVWVDYVIGSNGGIFQGNIIFNVSNGEFTSKIWIVPGTLME